MIKNITCTECPRGCLITAEYENDKIQSVYGFSCERGKKYAENEVICPRRVLTTTMKTRDGSVVPVKTDKPVKKSEMLDIMTIINGATANLPVSIGDVLIKNVTEDINVVATDYKNQDYKNSVSR